MTRLKKHIHGTGEYADAYFTILERGEINGARCPIKFDFSPDGERVVHGEMEPFHDFTRLTLTSPDHKLAVSSTMVFATHVADIVKRQSYADKTPNASGEFTSVVECWNPGGKHASATRIADIFEHSGLSDDANIANDLCARNYLLGLLVNIMAAAGKDISGTTEYGPVKAAEGVEGESSKWAAATQSNPRRVLAR